MGNKDIISQRSLFVKLLHDRYTPKGNLLIAHAFHTQREAAHCRKYPPNGGNRGLFGCGSRRSRLAPDTIFGSVIIRMRRRHPGERVEPFRHRIHAPQGARIREMIETWARSVTFEITEKLPNEIQDRDADVWELLITIADAVGGDWPKRARVAVALITEAKERDPSLGVRLLADLKSIFGVAQEMTTEAIAGAS